VDPKASPSPHRSQRHSFKDAALATAHVEKAVYENASAEEGIELIFDKLWQAAPTLGFDLRQERFEVFLNQSSDLA
jgi:hypothetical protein